MTCNIYIDWIISVCGMCGLDEILWPAVEHSVVEEGNTGCED